MENLSRLVDREIMESLLSRFTAAKGLLLPRDPLCESLLDIQPALAMSFVIKGFNDSVPYQLDLVLKLSKSTDVPSRVERWSKLERNAEGPRKFLNTSIVDIRE
jgi:hypothetical protein